ncbi:hypothetical protein SJX93_26320 [Streptomyces cyaneofuscatus]|uniref:hypothetical protein n=1 Tax=Streptomyces cyaneofuscatus TaxID=66883 RepID=UPI002D782C9C|nr:hypothetical protein [Streptomyces cyaneofuscatus]WRO12905.1 hypothetical protein SJX93_26320 [Streptomyces cyaneofuscatus]
MPEPRVHARLARAGHLLAVLGLALALVGGGTVPDAQAAPTPKPTPPANDVRPPGAADGLNLSRLKGVENPLLHPLLLPVADLRQELYRGLLAKGQKAAAEDAFANYRNGAVEFIDPTLVDFKTWEEMRNDTAEPNLDGQFWRFSLVRLDSVAAFLDPKAVARIRKESGPQLIAMSTLNVLSGERDGGTTQEKSIHSEVLLDQLRTAHKIPDAARLYAASERQQCERGCSHLHPRSLRTGFGWLYGLSTRAMELRAQRFAQIDASDATPRQRTKLKKQVDERLEEDRSLLNARTKQQLGHALDQVKTLADSDRDKTVSALVGMFHTDATRRCPPSSSVGQSLGRGLPGVAAPVMALRAAAPCGEAEEADRAQPGAEATGLGQALAGPALNPGGIDFTSMELRYLADPGDGSGLQYAFEAGRDPWRGDARTSTGLSAATLSSDAFFVWLSLRPQDFWVNLNPDEPDRIVDRDLGSTDAGRVLLQADLLMKKTVGKLIHPDTGAGKGLWNRIKGQCLSFRTWIVPAPASVHQQGDKLYILDAPLDVKMETQYLKSRGVTAGQSCPRRSKADEEHNERVYRDLVLSKLKKAINTDRDYADLRRVYLARVAAEWYRSLSRTRETTYGSLIDRGDADAWRTKTSWKPTDTFDAFVRSYTKGEFKVTRRATRGNAEYVTTYTYGGVDLTRVPMRNAPRRSSPRRWSGRCARPTRPGRAGRRGSARPHPGRPPDWASRPAGCRTPLWPCVSCPRSWCPSPDCCGGADAA